MSGVVSDLAGMAQALAGGGAVTLGPFTFNDTEVPEKLAYGSQQVLAVQKMLGGARVVNTLGQDAGDIKWSGTMRGPDQAQRVNTLVQMASSGQIFPLAWADEYQQVVIRSFQPQAQAFFTSYTITCCVVPPPLSAGTGSPDLLTSLAGDAMQAVGLSPADLPAMGSALGQVQDAVLAASVLVPGSSAFASVVNATGAAQAALTGVQATANGNLLGVVNAGATGAGLLGATSATSAINRMGGVVQAAGDLGAATQALGYINRMSKNLGA